MGTEEKKGYKILLGTTSQWTASTITPNAGQICIDTDARIVKIGDGINKYSNLPHLTDDTEITHLLNSFQFEYAEDESKISLTPIGGETVYEITLTDLDKIKQIYQAINLTGQTIAYIDAPVEIPDPATEDHISLSVGGNAIFQGNVTIQGDTTVVDAENLKVKDKLITVAKDNAAALTSPAGLHVPDYDGEGHDGALVFDHTGTAYVGDVTVDSTTGELTDISQLQPLATRTNLADGRLVKWDGTKNTLVNSGKTVEDFVPKIKNEDQNFKCYVEQGLTDGSSKTMTLQATIGDFSNSIIQRDANGRAKINAPTTDLDGKYIVNKEYVDGGFVAKRTTTTPNQSYLYGYDSNGDKQFQVTSSPNAGSVAYRGNGGTIKVGTPIGVNDATTKAYVDGLNTITITAGA